MVEKAAGCRCLNTAFPGQQDWGNAWETVRDGVQFPTGTWLHNGNRRHATPRVLLPPWGYCEWMVLRGCLSHRVPLDTAHQSPCPAANHTCPRSTSKPTGWRASARGPLRRQAAEAAPPTAPAAAARRRRPSPRAAPRTTSWEAWTYWVGVGEDSGHWKRAGQRARVVNARQERANRCNKGLRVISLGA